MYASNAFIASDSGSIFSPWLGFSMHQLIMSRSVANLFILTWNFGNACGWVSAAKGWHIAQAHPCSGRVIAVEQQVALFDLLHECFIISLQLLWSHRVLIRIGGADENRNR